jgi:protein SCO1/2
MKLSRTIRVSLFAAMMLLAAMAQAQLYSEPKATVPMGKPESILKVGIDQHLNQQLPLDLRFRDENGAGVTLGQYFGSKPIILTMVYYTCPMLCGEVQSGLVSAMGILRFDAGQEFDVISVSINPNETPADAMAKKKQFLSRYHRAGAENGWHFLTGDKTNIDALAKAVGYRYNYDAKSGQYSHGTAIVVVTPEGKLAQYFYGIEYAPKDLRLALVEASRNKIGNVVDAITLYCFHYDPASGRYSAQILNVVRLAGLVTVFCMGGFLLVAFRREGRGRA